MTTPATLPDNVAALHALVLAAWAERDAERAENARLSDERDQLAGQNHRLRHLIRQLQRMQFGRRSEKLNPDSLPWDWKISSRQSRLRKPKRRRLTRRSGALAPRSGVLAAARCRIICRGSSSSSSPTTPPAPAAAEQCVSSAKTAHSGST